MKTYFVMSGSVRGDCPHKHRTISGAARCSADDSIGCARQGGYSDRNLVVVQDGRRRDPTESEYADFCDRLDQLNNA